MKRAFLVAATLPVVLAACGSPSTTVTLNAAGATFPAPLYQNWFQSLFREKGIKVNYQAIGSGAGVRQFDEGTTDFGATDKAIEDDKIKEPVVHIPMSGGAIVPAYNNEGCDAKMTQAELADVYLGHITDWSHFGCEAKPITVVYRSDGSGTTAGFTASLAAFSPEWAESVGSGKAVNFPIGTGAKGNSGVAGQIKSIDGSIGYLNYGYVVSSDFQQVAVQNKAGNYVTANAETSAAGLSQIVLDEQLRGSDPNPEGENSYPIVSLTWVIARPVDAKNEHIKPVLEYMLSDESQNKADSLGYVPLPEAIRESAREAVDSLRID